MWGGASLRTFSRSQVKGEGHVYTYVNAMMAEADILTVWLRGSLVLESIIDISFLLCYTSLFLSWYKCSCRIMFFCHLFALVSHRVLYVCLVLVFELSFA